MPSPPPDGKLPDEPPPTPSHEKGRHIPDKMYAFYPISEDDIDDNGIGKYMDDNNDEGRD